MTLQLCGLCLIVLLVCAIVCMARQNSKQAAKLKALKRELEGISRAQEIANSIYSMPDSLASSKLHEVAIEQQRRMQDRKF